MPCLIHGTPGSPHCRIQDRSCAPPYLIQDTPQKTLFLLQQAFNQGSKDQMFMPHYTLLLSSMV